MYQDDSQSNELRAEENKVRAPDAQMLSQMQNAIGDSPGSFTAPELCKASCGLSQALASSGVSTMLASGARSSTDNSMESGFMRAKDMSAGAGVEAGDECPLAVALQKIQTATEVASTASGCSGLSTGSPRSKAGRHDAEVLGGRGCFKFPSCQTGGARLQVVFAAPRRVRLGLCLSFPGRLPRVGFVLPRLAPATSPSTAHARVKPWDSLEVGGKFGWTTAGGRSLLMHLVAGGGPAPRARRGCAGPHGAACDGPRAVHRARAHAARAAGPVRTGMPQCHMHARASCRRRWARQTSPPVLR